MLTQIQSIPGMTDQISVRISREDIKKSLTKLKEEAANAHSLVQLMNLEINEIRPEILVLMNEIDRQCATITEQIDKLLIQLFDDSTPESLKEVDLMHTVERAIRLLKPEPEIKILVPSLLPRIMADEHVVLRIFLNILGNIIKFSKKAQIVIEISAETMSHQHKVFIRDNGPGITQSRLNFMQDSLVNNGLFDIDSVSLCFALAKREIESLGGNINISSLPNKGTTFELVFRRRQ